MLMREPRPIQQDQLLGEGPEAANNPLLPLEVEGLNFEIQGKPLIQNVDLRVTGPGITVVMGPNGAGKSVLLRLLHGLLKPSSGVIRWRGIAVGESVRQRQAMVFQRPVLLRRSVGANIDFVLRLRRVGGINRRESLLDDVGLRDRAQQPARQLSGGEQQRLSLARALALKPEVVFLDEPTASLDPASVKMIETILLRVREKGTKIIFVTHDIAQARRLADDIIFIHAGRIIEQSEAGPFFGRPTTTVARAYLAGKIIV